MGLSKPQVSTAGIASISVHDKIGLHRVCVKLDGLSVPKVTTIGSYLPDEDTQICLDTFRGLKATWQREGLSRMKLMEPATLASFFSFAGTLDNSVNQVALPAVDEVSCPTLQPFISDCCYLDARSGRVLFPVRSDRRGFPHFHIMYFA